MTAKKISQTLVISRKVDLQAGGLAYDIEQSFISNPNIELAETLLSNRDKILAYSRELKAGEANTNNLDVIIFILSGGSPLGQTDFEYLQTIVDCWPRTPIIAIWPFKYLPKEDMDFFSQFSPPKSVIFRRRFTNWLTLEEMCEKINNILYMK